MSAEQEPGTVLAPVDVDAVLAAHVRWHEDDGTCSQCGMAYPCVTRRLAEELAAVRAGAVPAGVLRCAVPLTPEQAAEIRRLWPGVAIEVGRLCGSLGLRWTHR